MDRFSIEARALMAWKHWRWLLFLGLTILFTLFGQGRSEHWTFVSTDKQGSTFLIEEQSVKWNGRQVSFLLRTETPEGRASKARPYLLDLERRTLVATDEEGLKPDAIKPGTVAFELYKFFSARQPGPSR